MEERQKRGRGQFILRMFVEFPRASGPVLGLECEEYRANIFLCQFCSEEVVKINFGVGTMLSRVQMGGCWGGAI